MNIKISARALAFCAHFQAKQDIRYYLNGVHVQPMPAEAGGGVLVAATNGHAMGIWRDANGSTDREVIIRTTPGLLSAAAKGGIVKVVDNRLAVIRLDGPEEIEDCEAFVQANGDRAYAGSRSAPPWEVEGKFPDVARAVPDLRKIRATQGQHLGVLSATYLELIAKAIPSDVRSKGCGVAIRQLGKDLGALVTYTRIPEAAAVIMPMRDDAEPGLWLEHWQRLNQPAEAPPQPEQQPSEAAPGASE